MGAFCCHGSQTKKQTGKLLAILPLVKLHLYQISHTASVVLEEMSITYLFIYLFIFYYSNLILPCQPNKMATGHQTGQAIIQ